MGKIRSSLARRFLNIGTVDTPVWALLNKGIPEMSTAYNPETTSETYIAEDNASNSVDSYAPNAAITQTAFADDDVFDFVDNLRITRAIQEDAKAEILDVFLYREENATTYVAEKNAVTIQIDNFDVTGGAPASIAYTILFDGDPISGTAVITDNKPVFTAA